MKLFNFVQNRKNGFTLIELMVVISIIGLISSIILVALNNARSSSKYARIKQEVIQMRNKFELSRSSDGTYPTTILSPNNNSCSNFNAAIGVSDGVAQSVASDIVKVNGGTGSASNGALPANTPSPTAGLQVFTDANATAIGCALIPTTATRYAIYAAIGTGGSFTGYFCADSIGNTSTGSATSLWATINTSASGKCI